MQLQKRQRRGAAFPVSPTELFHVHANFDLVDSLVEMFDGFHTMALEPATLRDTPHRIAADSANATVQQLTLQMAHGIVASATPPPDYRDDQRQDCHRLVETFGVLLQPHPVPPEQIPGT